MLRTLRVIAMLRPSDNLTVCCSVDNAFHLYRACLCCPSVLKTVLSSVACSYLASCSDLCSVKLTFMDDFKRPGRHAASKRLVS